MRNFLTNSKIIRTLFLCLIAAGCVKPSQQASDSDESSATFSLKEASLEWSIGEVDPNFKIPLSKIFNYTLCLQDKRTLESVIGHSFRVEGGDSPQNLTTNVSGCLVWNEKVKFNDLATQTFIAQERKIIATGVHSGVRTFKFAFNPWVKDNFFIDLKYHPDALNDRDLVLPEKSQEALKSQKKLPVWPDNFVIQSSDIGSASSKRQIQIRAEFNPNVYVSASHGPYTARPLLDGVFQLHMYFVAETQDGKKFVVLEVSPPEKIRMENSKLKFSSVVNAPQSLEQGELKLAFQLIPVDGPEALVEYDGIYTLGDSDKIVGTFSPKLIKDFNNVNSDFSIVSYLNNAVTANGQKINFDSVKNQMSLKQASLDEIKELNLVSTNSLVIGKNKDGFKVQAESKFQSMNKQVFDRNLRFTTCVNKADGTPLIGRTFKIKSFTGIEVAPQKTTVENKGCLEWIEKFSNISNYAFQIPKAGFISLTSDEGDVLRIDTAIDPTNDNPMLDLRIPSEREEYETIQRNSKNFKMTVALNDFSIVPKSDATYSIDKTLNLDTTQAFNFDLKLVKVQRNDRPDGVQSEIIRDGFYLLRLALQKDYIDYVDLKSCKKKHLDLNGKVDGCERQHVTTTQKVVEFEGGHIKNGTFINLFFSDWRFRKTINNILVEFYPLDFSKLNPKNIDQQIADLNIRFSGPMKSPESIQLFDSLIDRKSNLYSNENFVGQIVPMEVFGVDPKLEINTKERLLKICESKHCPTSPQANIEYDSNDADPEISKFKQGNYHLQGVKVEDLMNIERQQLTEFNLHKNQEYNFSDFIRNTMSDVVILGAKELSSPLDPKLNQVLPIPQKNATHVEGFLNTLNRVSPDYEKTQYFCPIQSLAEFGLDMACPMSKQIMPPRMLLNDKRFYKEVLIQDRMPEFDNYLPKITLDSLKQLMSYSIQTPSLNETENAKIIKANDDYAKLRRAFANRMCYFWFSEFIPKQRRSFTEIYQPSNFLTRKYDLAAKIAKNLPTISNQNDRTEDLVDSCILDIFKKGSDSVFYIEKKLQVYNFKQNEDLQPVEYFGITVNSSESVGLTISKTISDSSSLTFNPVAFIGMFLKSNLLGLFTFAGFNFSHNDGDSNSSSVAKGADTSTSVSLDVEQANIRLNLLAYDPCLNIRLNPGFIKSHKLIQRVGPTPEKGDIRLQNEKLNILGRGLLICGGEKITTPLAYTEKYYFVSQAIPNANVIRRFDFRANHYSFKLRGDNELRTFYSLIAPKGADSSAPLNMDHNTRLNIDDRMKGLNSEDASLPYREPSYPSVITLY